MTPPYPTDVSGKVPMLARTAIEDCFLFRVQSFDDKRGSFVKIYQEEEYLKAGLETQFPEEFYTRSAEGVLRGIHFTVPPIDQVKVITCLHGSVLDAVVDLRTDSQTFKQHLLFELNAEHPTSIYIGKGLGHAFYVPQGEAVLLYRVSTRYMPEYDAGIRWDSAGIDWPTSAPVISERDQELPRLTDFRSPFKMRL